MNDPILLEKVKKAHYNNKHPDKNIVREVRALQSKITDPRTLVDFCYLVSYLPISQMPKTTVAGQAIQFISNWRANQDLTPADKGCIFDTFDLWYNTITNLAKKNKTAQQNATGQQNTTGQNTTGQTETAQTGAKIGPSKWVKSSHNKDTTISWLDEVDTASETSDDDDDTHATSWLDEVDTSDDDDDDVIDTRVHTTAHATAHATSWLDDVETASSSSSESSESESSESSDSETELSDSETESESESEGNLEPPPDTSNESSFGDIDPVLAGLEPKQESAASDAHLQELKKKDDDILAGINEMLESAGLEKITQE